MTVTCRPCKACNPRKPLVMFTDVLTHVGIRVWDDIGREIVGVHLLAEGCELLCGIDHSNWKVLRAG